MKQERIGERLKWLNAALNKDGEISRVRAHAGDRNSRLRNLLDDNVSIDAAYTWIMNERHKDAAPQVMIEALVFSLHECGTAALAEPNAQRRIGAISEQQLHEVSGRLKWPEADIECLVEQWTQSHG
jgi:hypothetical protein